MRALKTKDLGLFSKIVSKLDLKDELDNLFVTIDGKGKTKLEIEKEQAQLNYEIGIKLIMVLVENYFKAEEEVYTLLANLTDQKKQDIEDLPLNEFIELLMKIKDDESFDSFFKSVTQ